MTHEVQTSQRVQKKPSLTISSFQKFLEKFNNDWSMTFAGALAYSLLMAVLPIALAVFSVLGFLLGENRANTILKSIIDILPGLSSQQQAIERQLEQLSSQAGFLAWLAILLAVFGGSRLFLAMEGCLNIVYRVRPRTFLPQNTMAILMMLLFIILVPIMFFAALLPSLLLQIVQNYPFLKQFPFFLWLANNAVTTYSIGFMGGLLAAFLLFAAIYLVVPNKRIRLRNTLPGALVAALATVIFLTVVFPLYTTHFMGSYVGQAGFVVILLVFFYYFAVILIFGAEVNAFFFEGIQPIPNDLATFVSTMAGRLNRDFPGNEGSHHVDPQPTEDAHEEHVAHIREESEEIEERNRHKQQSLLWEKHVQAQKKQVQKPKIALTLLEVLFGSLLAMIVQLFQTRKREREK